MKKLIPLFIVGIILAMLGFAFASMSVVNNSQMKRDYLENNDQPLNDDQAKVIPSAPEAEIDKATNIDVENFQYQATLSDVSGGDGYGVVMSGFFDQKYTMAGTFTNLPEPTNGDFYEGWIVRKSPQSVISTGKLQKNELESSYDFWANFFTDEADLTDHTTYVLTLEPDDGDPAPAEHILEGEFQVVDESRFKEE